MKGEYFKGWVSLGAKGLTLLYKFRLKSPYPMIF